MSIQRTILTVMAAATLALTGCANQTGQKVVTSGSSAGKVVYGTIVSYEAVTIKDKKQLSDNALGGLTGGVAGGVAGNAVGGGRGQTLATIGGVVAGAVLGAAIEDKLSTKSGYEYIVQLDGARNPNQVGNKRTRTVRSSSQGGIEDELAESVMPDDRAMDAVSVIQDDKQPIPVGSRVMIIYRDDGTRVTAMR